MRLGIAHDGRAFLRELMRPEAEEQPIESPDVREAIFEICAGKKTSSIGHSSTGPVVQHLGWTDIDQPKSRVIEILAIGHIPTGFEHVRRRRTLCNPVPPAPVDAERELTKGS